MTSSYLSGLMLIAVVLASSQSLQHGKYLPSFHVRAVTDRQTSLFGARGGNQRDMASTDGSKATEDFMKFYTLKGGMCPYAARTWIALLELGIPFELIEVSPIEKEDWYLEINPRGKVPALLNTEDGSVVYESAICDEYLSDLARHMDTSGPGGKGQFWKLMPIIPSERAALRLLNDHVDNALFPAQFTFLMNKDTKKDSELIEQLETALGVLEKALVSSKGPYLMGETFSMADIHVLPFFLRLTISLKHFKGYEIPADRFSHLLAWYDLCSQRNSVMQAARSEDEIIKVYNRFVELDYAFGGLNKNNKK